MRCHMTPRLTVRAEAILWSTVDVVVASEDRQHDRRHDDDLSGHALEEANGKQVRVASETARMDSDGVIQDSNPHDSRDAKPFRGRIGSATQGQGEAG